MHRENSAINRECRKIYAKEFCFKIVNMTGSGKGQELIIRNVFCESVFLSILCVDVLQIQISCYVCWAHFH